MSLRHVFFEGPTSLFIKSKKKKKWVTNRVIRTVNDKWILGSFKSRLSKGIYLLLVFSIRGWRCYAHRHGIGFQAYVSFGELEWIILLIEVRQSPWTLPFGRQEAYSRMAPPQGSQKNWKKELHIFICRGSLMHIIFPNKTEKLIKLYIRMSSNAARKVHKMP